MRAIYTAMLSVALAMPAHAQGADARPAPGSGGNASDASEPATADILVTARRREERAQDVPIALTALTGAQVAVPGTVGLAQVAQLAPSLQITATNPRQTNINIRGLGATPAFASIGLEYGVGVYVDQVYYPRPTQAAFDLYDLDRVEVLRGPQGTLFGKNTTAGAINISTQAPSFTPGFRGEVSFGNYSSVQARASGTAPINDRLAIRLTVTDTVRDQGFVKNVRGDRLSDLDSFGIRGQLLFKATDTVTLRLIGDYSDFRQNCCIGELTSVRTTRANGTAVPANFYQRAARFGYVPLPIDPYGRELDLNRPTYLEVETYGGTAIIDADLGAATLTSVTAARKLTFRPATDGDLTPLDIFTNAGVSEDQRQFSQELRLASNGRRPIDYVVGLYYLNERLSDRLFTDYGRDAALWILGPAAGGTAPSAGGQAALDGFQVNGSAQARTRSYAAFGQLTWHVLPRLDLTGGLRFTRERKTGFFGQAQGGTALTPAQILLGAQAIRNSFGAVVPRFDARSTESKLSGVATLAYHFTPDVLAYATYSRGFKSSGLNLNAVAAPVAGIATPPLVIAPERVENVEAGVKTTLLDHHVTLDLAAFTTRIRNYQSQQIDTTLASTAYIANVGTVRSRGLEGDLTIRPARGLSLFASGSLIDADYRSFRDAPCPLELQPQASCDLSGRRLPGVSRYNASGGGEYDLAIGGTREGYLAGDVSYRSRFNSIYNLAQDGVIRGYAVVNARIGLRARGGRWDVSVYARNLFDAHYLQIITPSAFNTGQYTGLTGDPRTYGITLRTQL